MDVMECPWAPGRAQEPCEVHGQVTGQGTRQVRGSMPQTPYNKRRCRPERQQLCPEGRWGSGKRRAGSEKALRQQVPRCWNSSGLWGRQSDGCGELEG